MKKDASLVPRFIVSLVLLITVVSLALSGSAVLYERRTLLNSLRANTKSSADFTAAALGYPVWNIVFREINVLMEWTFRDPALYGAVLTMEGMDLERIAMRRGASGSVERGMPEPEANGIVERRGINFDGRTIGTLELYFTERLVDDRLTAESIFIAFIVLILDGVLGVFLFLVLRRMVFRPLARIERWAASLERGEEFAIEGADPRDHGEIASLRASIERMVDIIMSKEREYRSLFDDSPVSIWELDFSRIKDVYGLTLAAGTEFSLTETRTALSLLRVKSVNPITLAWLGVASLKDIPGGMRSLLGDDVLRLLLDEMRALSAGSAGAAGDCRLRMPSGEVRNFAVRCATIEGYEADWTRVLLTAADITDRALAEERLISALNEKNILLRELFHRTRNSLQLISSMIALREPRGDGSEKADLRAIRNRIGTIALAQDKLYEAGDLTTLDLGSYCADLVSMLSQEHAEASSRVRLDVRTEFSPVSIDQAVPLGLLLCELASNAYDHAFPDGRTGTLSVTLKHLEGGSMELSISDDGVGLPPGIDPRRGATTGFGTVVALGERQLRGRLTFSSEAGFSAVFRFDLAEITPRV